MAHLTTLKAAEIIGGEIKNCGIESEHVNAAARTFIDAGVSVQAAEGIAELIFAVYFATKKKYGLTLGSEDKHDQPNGGKAETDYQTA